MVALIRRQPEDVVLESTLRKNLIAEGLIAEYKEGSACMQAGCSLCVAAPCPMCGRLGTFGEVLFLVDEQPYVRLGTQSMVAHAQEQGRGA